MNVWFKNMNGLIDCIEVERFAPWDDHVFGNQIIKPIESNFNEVLKFRKENKKQYEKNFNLMDLCSNNLNTITK